MAAHELPAAVHDHDAVDRLRRRALELVAELDEFDPLELLRSEDTSVLWRWAGSASVILKELAHG